MNLMRIMEVGRNIHICVFLLFILIFYCLEQTSSSANPIANKRRGSVAADFAPPRLIVSERQQMAVLKQLTAGDESNSMFFSFFNLI